MPACGNQKAKLERSLHPAGRPLHAEYSELRQPYADVQNGVQRQITWAVHGVPKGWVPRQTKAIVGVPLKSGCLCVGQDSLGYQARELLAGKPLEAASELGIV